MVTWNQFVEIESAKRSLMWFAECLKTLQRFFKIKNLFLDFQVSLRAFSECFSDMFRDASKYFELI